MSRLAWRLMHIGVLRPPGLPAPMIKELRTRLFAVCHETVKQFMKEKGLV